MLGEKANKTKTLTFVALMAILSTILSIEPFSFPLAIGPFSSEIHFAQIPIFMSRILVGSRAGFLTGANGGLYMSIIRIPFIIGGLATLGLAAGFFVKKLKMLPLFACILTWCVQAPYVFVSYYIWFVYFIQMPASIALTTFGTILVKPQLNHLFLRFLWLSLFLTSSA